MRLLHSKIMTATICIKKQYSRSIKFVQKVSYLNGSSADLISHGSHGPGILLNLLLGP